MAINWRTLLIAWLSSVSSVSQAESQQAINFGVFPYLSPEKLIAFYTPLKNLLSATLVQPVSIVSAPDFQTFIERTRNGAYDYVITAPHLGRLAELESGYQRIARTLRSVQGVYLVRKDSEIHNLADLRDRKVMIAQKISLLFQMSERQLGTLGLRDGENITILETRTHNNAMWAPLRGEADAAVTGARLFDKLSHARKDRLRVIDKTPVAPGLILMAHPRIPKGDVDRLQQALLAYAESPAGKEYFDHTGARGFALISDAVMRDLDPYLPPTKRKE